MIEFTPARFGTNFLYELGAPDNEIVGFLDAYSDRFLEGRRSDKNPISVTNFLCSISLPHKTCPNRGGREYDFPSAEEVVDLGRERGLEVLQLAEDAFFILGRLKGKD